MCVNFVRAKNCANQYASRSVDGRENGGVCACVRACSGRRVERLERVESVQRDVWDWRPGAPTRLRLAPSSVRWTSMSRRRLRATPVHTRTLPRLVLLVHTDNNNNNNTRLTALFRDYPGEPVPER